MPAGTPPWVRFEGVWSTPRSVAMLKEARKIYGPGYPRISQGGRNAGGVAASAGTHDVEAFDFATAGMSPANQQRWEDALWQVGFASWWRRFIWNVWPEHNHTIPKGGWLSRGAAAQERAFINRRDGLAGNRAYPRIGAYATRTWEQYKAIKARSLRSISLWQINYARANPGRYNAHAEIWQTWLARKGFYKATVDGRFASGTQKATDAFRRSLGWSAADSTGPIGVTSLRALRNAAKSPRTLRQGK